MLTVYLDSWDLSEDHHSLLTKNYYTSIGQRISSLSMSSRVEIIHAPSGKPRVLQPEGWYFNLSHSGDLAYCAYAAVEIGVDLELHKNRNYRLIAETWFQKKEQILVQDSGSLQSFYTLWTRKEAWLKMHGKSIWDLGQTPDMTNPSSGIQSYLLEWKGQSYSLSWSLFKPDYQEVELIPFSPSPGLMPIIHL